MPIGKKPSMLLAKKKKKIQFYDQKGSVLNLKERKNQSGH